MKSIPEMIRRLLTANVETKFGAFIYLVFGVVVLEAPAFVLEYIYLGPSEHYISIPFCTLLVGMALFLKSYTVYGIIRIILWVWSAVAVATKTDWPTWIAIVFYILMAIGLLRLSTIWWSDDNKLFGNGVKS